MKTPNGPLMAIRRNRAEGGPARPAFPPVPGPLPRTALRIAPLLSVIAALAACSAGCGYSLEPIHRAGVRSVHVPVVSNETRRFGLEVMVTGALASELRQAGWKIRGPSDCDAVLNCSIAAVTEEVLAEDPAGLVPQARLNIRLSWSLRSRKGPVLAEGEVAGGGEAVMGTFETRESGLRRAAAECARAVVRALEPRPGGA